MDRSFVELREELTEEHRKVRWLVDEIRDHRTLAELRPLLEELHTTLIRHFSHEQFPGGLYEYMGARESRYHPDLKILIEDHCNILSSVRGLLERTRMPTTVNEATLLVDVDRVIEYLIDHEHREHALADKLMPHPEG